MYTQFIPLHSTEYLFSGVNRTEIAPSVPPGVPVSRLIRFTGELRSPRMAVYIDPYLVFLVAPQDGVEWGFDTPERMDMLEVCKTSPTSPCAQSWQYAPIPPVAQMIGSAFIHSLVERRYKCHTCGKTFAETCGTPERKPE